MSGNKQAKLTCQIYNELIPPEGISVKILKALLGTEGQGKLLEKLNILGLVERESRPAGKTFEYWYKKRYPDKILNWEREAGPARYLLEDKWQAAAEDENREETKKSAKSTKTRDNGKRTKKESQKELQKQK